MKKIFISFIVAFGFLSCSNEFIEPILSEVTDGLNDEILPTDSVKVNAQEVENVVESIFGKASSRSGNQTMETITDADGNPLIYVVNNGKNRGFVLISAIKDITPILAYNTQGHFDIDGEMPDGLQNWKESTAGIISNSSKLGKEDKFINRLHWKKFENKSKAIFGSRSVPLGDLQEQQTAVMTKMQELSARGYEVYTLDGTITGDKDFDNEIKEYAQGGIWPEYEEYWDILSFVALKTTPDEIETIPNFVQTTWNQSGLYNQTFPQIGNAKTLAGCGPVAIGQALRYFEYPVTYNWDGMPYNQGSVITSNFLYEIAQRANATLGVNGTSTTPQNCLAAVQSYNYNATLGNNGSGWVLDEIRADRPVIMFGWEENYVNGHAWLATGSDYTFYDTPAYEVWTFTTRSTFKHAYSFFKGFSSSTLYFYMNWGWGGNYDGMYLDKYLDSPLSGNRYIIRQNIYLQPNN